jgi:DNA mismatch repair protein MutS2
LSLEQEGIVERADSPKVEVNISGKRWKMDREDLALATGADHPLATKGPRRIAEGIILDTEGEDALPLDLNLIGCKVEEALLRADKFLDQCMLAGRRSVRLVHGHGKGVLRRALAEFLKVHPHVAGTRLADENEGGAAVTLVQLNS